MRNSLGAALGALLLLPLATSSVSAPSVGLAADEAAAIAKLESDANYKTSDLGVWVRGQKLADLINAMN